MKHLIGLIVQVLELVVIVCYFFGGKRQKLKMRIINEFKI